MALALLPDSAKRAQVEPDAAEMDGLPSPQSATSGPVVYCWYHFFCGLSVAGMFSCGGVGG